MKTKYGDSEKLKNDIKTLWDINSRQGSSLLIDVIAETVGETVNKFKLNEQERANLRNSLINELKEALLERT